MLVRFCSAIRTIALSKGRTAGRERRSRYSTFSVRRERRAISVRRTPKEQIWQQSQDRRHNQRLFKIQPTELHDLVHAVYDHRGNKDRGDIFPTVSKEPSSVVRIGQHGPAVPNTTLLCISEAGSNREDVRHRWLNNESKR